MKTIGATTTYTGTDHPYLTGHRVKIVAIHHGVLINPDDYQILRDDDAISTAGGVDPSTDLVEVAPVKGDGTPSFVTSDARVADLEMFRGE